MAGHVQRESGIHCLVFSKLRVWILWEGASLGFNLQAVRQFQSVWMKF